MTITQGSNILPTARPQYVTSQDVVVPDGLVIHLPMDGSSVTLGSQANDVTQNAQDGTLGGSVKPFMTYAQDGQQGGLRFTNGSSTLLLPTVGSKLVFGTSPRTICTWMYLPNYNQFVVPLFYGATAGSGLRFLFYVDLTTHHLIFDPIASPQDSGLIPSLNVWHHVACVIYNGTDIAIWMDGRYQQSTNNSLNTSSTLTAHGINTDDGTTSVYGDVIYRDWRFYNRALGQGELSTIMEAGVRSGLPLPYLGQSESAVLLAAAAAARKTRSFASIIG